MKCVQIKNIGAFFLVLLRVLRYNYSVEFYADIKRSVLNNRAQNIYRG